MDRRAMMAGAGAALAASASWGAERREAVIGRIDHISSNCPDSKALFELMTGPLGLPVAFPFMPRGPRAASGGVFVGNMALEIGTYNSPPSQARVTALVFAPERDNAASLAEMRRRGQPHGELIQGRNGPGLDAPLLWILLDAKEMGVDGLRVVLCEYRIDVKTLQDAARRRLKATHGGPLGMVRAREVTLAARDLPAAIGRWRRLLAPARERGGRFAPAEGPALRLTEGPSDAFSSVILEVASLERARRFLETQKVAFSARPGALDLAPGLQGLPLRLVQA